MDADLVKKITELERRLDNLSLHERGWVPTFFDDPLTNTDFDGDSFSDVAVHTKIENTSWSTTIPSDAKALILRAVCRDSGSAGTNGLYLWLYPASASTSPCFSVYLNGIPNDQSQSETAIVPCTNGDIWYRVNASAASTFDIWLYCWGYWT